MKKYILLTIIAAFAVAFAGCGASDTNSNNTRNAPANRTNTNVSNANTSTTSKWDPKILKEEYEKSRAKREVDKGLDTFGDTLEESWLWFKVRSALTMADDLRESTVKVAIAKDVVTLTGTVRDEAQKKRAGEVAKVDGVASVKNELKVAPKDSVTNSVSLSTTDSDKPAKPAKKQ